MSQKQKEYIIRIPCKDGERGQALTFISEQMQKTYGSKPPEETAPKELFIALHANAIIGTLATEYGTKDAPLPFERLFDFDPLCLPLPYAREKTIYYSRWTSASPGAGQILWLVASVHAEDRGMTTSVAMIKKFVQEQFLKFGCEWAPIPDARLRADGIAPSDHNYFFTGPAPYPCMGIIKDQIRRLPEIVERIREKYDLKITVEA